MRSLLTCFLFACTFALAGCTTRSDREKNKDYDRPKSIEKEKDAK